MTGKKKETTQTTTRQAFRTRDESTKLSWKEEMVVRMRHGLSEGDDHPLEFHGQHVEEPKARLAMMEAELLAAMHQRGPLAEEQSEEAGTDVDESLRSKIMQRLSGLDEDDS